jgi:D-glycero-D-manno-heptose 1,7-bisphosphate phosphatase
MPRRAIFVDRDGTLCEKNGLVADPEQLRLMPSAAAAVRRFNSRGWQVIVVTDQPGVAFGELDEDILANIHERLRGLLLEEGARLDGIYHCPHHPEGKVERYRRDCACRGPGIALFERARDEMGIDLDDSLFVSPSAGALRAAAACGVKPADSMDAAVEWALQRQSTSGVPAS